MKDIFLFNVCSYKGAGTKFFPNHVPAWNQGGGKGCPGIDELC